MRGSIVFAAFLLGAAVIADEPTTESDAAKLRRYSEQALRLADKLEPRQQVTILTSVAAIRKGAAVAPLLAQAFKVANGRESFERLLLLRQVARAFVLNGDVESALGIAGQAGKYGVPLRQQIIKDLTEAGRLEDALALANRVATDSLRLDALTGVAQAQARAGKIDAALKTADVLKELPLNRAVALQDIAIALAKAQRKDAALKTMVEARGLIDQAVAAQRRSTVLASFAVDQAAAGDIVGGRRTLDSLNLATDSSFMGIKRDIYCRFAVEQTKWGDAAGAIRFAEALSDAPDRTSVLLQITKTQIGRNDLESARVTVEAAERHFGNVRGAKEKQELSRSFAPLHARLGNPKRAHEHLATVVDATWFVISACAIAQEHEDAGQRDDAIATLRQVLPKAKQVTQTLLGPNAVHALCEESGRLNLDQEATALIDDLKSPVLKAYGWLGLARGVEHRLRMAFVADPSEKLQPESPSCSRRGVLYKDEVAMERRNFIV